jgi:hypothetical protein
MVFSLWVPLADCLISIVVLWVLTPYGLVGGSGFSPEDGSDPYLRIVVKRPHGFRTQRTTIDIFTTVRTSNVREFDKLHGSQVA